MKPAAFAYSRPTTLDEVYALLDQHGEEARLLAGGQSLMAGLNMRLSEPAILIDINKVAGLDGISEDQTHITIGALTRHYQIGSSPLVADHLPLVAEAIPHIAHAAIRNRGTFGGSLANADPAAELPACAVALNARIEIGSATGTRSVPAEEFFHGFFETGLGDNEVLTGVRFAKARHGECGALEEVARRRGDFASVGLAAHGTAQASVFKGLRLVFFGIAGQPVLATATADVLAGRIVDAEVLAAARAALKEDIEPLADLHNSAEMKMHLAGVVLERALARMGG